MFRNMLKRSWLSIKRKLGRTTHHNTGANAIEDGHANTTIFTGLTAIAALVLFGIIRFFRKSHR